MSNNCLLSAQASFTLIISRQDSSQGILEFKLRPPLVIVYLVFTLAIVIVIMPGELVSDQLSGDHTQQPLGL